MKNTVISTMLITIAFNFTNAQDMKELKTEIIINASSETVWNALTDLEKFNEWNPFIVASSGSTDLGETITNTMLLNGKENVFKPTVTANSEGEYFEWLGSGLLGMFKGRHYFSLEPIGPNQTKLNHGEKFSGLLSGMILKKIGAETLESFQKMNIALKDRCEMQDQQITKAE